MALPSASGGAPFVEWTLKVIRLVRHGCVNRPFFHIAVMNAKDEQYDPVIEQLGCYDPVPNKHNEKLVAVNFDRIDFWMKKGAILSLPVKQILGLAGYFPVHPKTYEVSWLRRKKIVETLEELKLAAAAKSNSENSTQ